MDTFMEIGEYVRNSGPKVLKGNQRSFIERVAKRFTQKRCLSTAWQKARLNVHCLICVDNAKVVPELKGKYKILI
jgi:GH43 family beta-xylosidase